MMFLDQSGLRNNMKNKKIFILFLIIQCFVFPVSAMNNTTIVDALEDIPKPLILIKDKLFNVIPFLIALIMFAGFGLALIVMTSKIKKWKK